MRFIDGYFDPAQGTSHVLIKHKNKDFWGRAKLHPDDTASNYTGCRYAELRAKIKALKYEYKEKKANCDACRNFVKSIEQYKDFDRTSPIAKIMYRQLNRRIKEVNSIADTINKLEFDLNIQISMQDNFENRIKAKND